MCKIDNETHDIFTNIECFVKSSTDIDNECGKRQIRGSSRKRVANEIGNQEVHVYKARKKRELQQQGDPEPPMIARDSVYANIKYENKKANYLDPDPFRAIHILETQPIGKNVIQAIGYRPFFVYIFSGIQVNLWNMYSAKVPLIIDSTSGVCMKITYPNKEKSRSIFLHIGVINCDHGQNVVLAALTERQDTLTIKHLLDRHQQSNGNKPLQCVSWIINKILCFRYE